MTKKGKNIDQPATAKSLREAIHLARLQEAQDIDKSVDRRSTEMARLEVLYAAVEHVFNDIPMEDDRFSLSLVPSRPARLWIDITTYVAMDNAAEVYRMIRNAGTGRRVLIETDDVGVMAGRITEYVAREIVAREREASGFSYDRIMTRRQHGGRARLALGGFIIGLLAGAGVYFLYAEKFIP